MSLSVPQRLLLILNMNDDEARTVGKALRWGDAEAFLDGAGKVCARVEGEIEIEEDGRRKVVKVRRTVDSNGALITEHLSGRQDLVLRPQAAGAGGQAPIPT